MHVLSCQGLVICESMREDATDKEGTRQAGDGHFNCLSWKKMCLVIWQQSMQVNPRLESAWWSC